MNWIKKLFTQPSTREIAAKELAEAERKALDAHTGIEWAQASLTYNQTRIKRLREYLSKETSTCDM